MKRFLVMLMMLLLPCAAWAESDGFYPLRDLITLRDGEELILCAEQSYYSGDPVYKGKTGKELTGACALHCASVVLSNLSGEPAPAQEVTAHNNSSKSTGKAWVAYVSWGRLENAYGVRFTGFDMAQYGTNLKRHGVKTADRRQQKLEELSRALTENAGAAGLIVHFNSSGRLNGSGKRHAVVVLGVIRKDGVVSDLLISDSSLPAPEGACVRLSRSSVPTSMLGEKKVNKADPDSLVLLCMDDVVSYRYVTAVDK